MITVGYFELTIRGDVDEPDCLLCSQTIWNGSRMFAALMTRDGSGISECAPLDVVAPFCESCANTD